jgi:hypothetical protein
MSISKGSSVKDIAQYLQEKLGVKAPSGATKAELLQLVLDNGGEVSGESAPVSDEQAGADIEALCKTKVRIKVYEKAGADSQLTVGINGEFTTIQRGVEVTVPYPIYSLLKNAVTTEYEQKGDEVIERKVETDPFSVIKFDVQPGEFEDAE